LPKVFRSSLTAPLPDDPTEQTKAVTDLLGGWNRYLASLAGYNGKIDADYEIVTSGRRKPRTKAAAPPEAELPLGERDEEEPYEVEHGGPTFDEP
jgi:hypothetical protein